MKAALLEVGTQNKETRLVWYCPGCRCDHGVPVLPMDPNGWGWNQSLDRPTLTPSVKVTLRSLDGGETRLAQPLICHCFVQEGRIMFCADSGHALAGKTVAMTDRD